MRKYKTNQKTPFNRYTSKEAEQVQVDFLSNLDINRLEDELSTVKEQLENFIGNASEWSSINRELAELEHLFCVSKTTKDFYIKAEKSNEISKIVWKIIDEYQHILPENIYEKLKEFADDSTGFQEVFYAIHIIYEGDKLENLPEQLNKYAAGFTSIANAIDEHWIIFSKEALEKLETLAYKVLDMRWEAEFNNWPNELKSLDVYRKMIRQSVGFILWKIEQIYKEEKVQSENTELSSKLPDSSRFRPASGRSLLRHAGTWVGDDIQECLQKVYDTRSEF